jgi:Cu(I)/Ag(I) efflux system membrane fusion protein
MTLRQVSKWLALVVVVTLVGFAAFRFGQSHAPRTTKPAAATQTATSASAKVDPKTGRTVLYWHDPMAPGQRFDKPGRSPFMDMDLVPVYADEAATGGVAISPGVTQSLGIRTAIARRAAVSTSIEAVGTVAENERAIHVVQSRVNGFVEKLHVRANLDAVTAGQPVATLFAPDWVAAQDEYLALRRLDTDPALVDAARQRLALLSIPPEVVRAAEASGKAQSRFTIRAPASGIVSDLTVREGAMVAPGMTLLRIVDLARVWVYGEVPETAGADVATGTTVQVHPAAFPGRTFDGRVSAVLPQLSAATRTLRVRIELANPGRVLVPGMLVNVTLSPKAGDAVVLVPQESVIPTGRRTVVVVQDDAGRFRPVDVQTGRVVGNETEIRSGIDAGQKVVVSGQFLLDSEASLKSGLPRLDTAPKPAVAPTQSHEGDGRIEAIDGEEITIDHGPIASLKWPAMSMPFSAPKHVRPAGLAVGDHVKFVLVKNAGGDMELARIEVVHAHGGKP